MGVEWSSWKMTRSPFGRKNCVYFIGGSTGALFAVAAEVFEPPLALLLCASAVRTGANSTAATSAASRRLQRMASNLRTAWVRRASRGAHADCRVRPHVADLCDL